MRATIGRIATGALACVVLLQLAACEKPGLRTDPPPRDPPAQTAPEADPTPYDLESEGEFPAPARDVEFEEDQLPPPEEVTSSALTDVEAVVEDAAESVEDMAPIESTEAAPAPVPAVPESVRGWRVQLAASGELADAERVAREAQSRLGAAIYVDFESGLYKVRAGDFTNRDAAQRLRARAQSNGYDGAWVVTTEVRPDAGS